MKRLSLFLFLFCLLLTVPSQAKIIYVDANGTADFNNIQAAINDSNDGDTIIVADGIYKGEGNRDIEFSELNYGPRPYPTKAITVRSAKGPGNCIIDCNGTAGDRHRGFGFENGEDSNSVISGFTIINGYARCESYMPPLGVCEYLGGAIYCWRSSPTISNCIISGNTAGLGYGGGISLFGSNATVRNCMFIGNSAATGGGIDVWVSSPTLTNCTFSGNWASESGGGVYNSGSSYTILSNCILWSDSPDEIYVVNTAPVVTYSNVHGGWPGIGNIGGDPCFIEPVYWEDPCNTPTFPWDDLWIGGDYHLKSQAGRWDPNSESWVQDDITSPCIDAGNPGCPLGDETAPNGNRRNMGAYGGTAEASKSPANWRNIADLTNDWVVDFNDLKIFVDYWLETGRCIPSDLNRDGFVDFNDFAIFGWHWSYPSASEPTITYQIVKCDPNSYRPFATEEVIETRFTVTVKGRYIHFKDMMVANCCTDKLGLEMTVEEDLITIYEIEYIPGVCFCICDYPVTATLGPFEPGTYTLEVYEEWSGFIASTTVVIAPPE